MQPPAGIVVPQSTSGIYLLEVVFPKLGIAERIKVKVTDRDAQSAAAVANGGADIAVQPVSALMNAPGIDYVGPLPSEVQYTTVFSSGVHTGATQPDAVKALQRFLTTAAATAVMLKHGLEAA